jgi:hypothetical protein
MHCVTLRAKLNFVLIAILFLGLAESATRVGVYSSNDCSEANLVGYTWYPYPRYPYSDFGTPGCYAANGSSPEQYYDIQIDLPEDIPVRPANWLYWLQDVDSPEGCATFNETNVVFAAGIPNTCLNYFSPFLTGSTRGRTFSFQMSSCNASYFSETSFDIEYNCPKTSYYSIPPTCTDMGFFLSKIICDTPAEPEAPVVAPSEESPVAEPVTSDTPTTAPTAATPTKKTSLAVSTFQISLVVSSIVIATSL